MSLRLAFSAIVVTSGLLAMASSVTPAGASFRSGLSIGAHGALGNDTREITGTGSCDQALYQRCAATSGRNQKVDQGLASSCMRCFPGIGFEVLSNQIGLGPFMQYGGPYGPPVCP
jgi:hypothetical protein